MKNILAENMIRFGTKNVSEADIKKRLTESTLKELDPLWTNASKFFAAEWVKQANAPQFATANLLYVARPAKDNNMETSGKYLIGINKAIVSSFGPISFIWPTFMGFVDYTSANGLTDTGDLVLSYSAENLREKDLKTAAASINSFWSEILPDVAKTHLDGRKAKLATSIASIKSSPNFAELAPLLTGTAKSVYDMIAAA